MAVARPNVSIVVSSRGDTPFLDDCVASLHRDPTVLEVLVVPEDVSAGAALRR